MSLCGWPVEQAAALIGETIDCTALLQAGEDDDEETAAVNAMLSTLSGEFGEDPFTARDIVKIIEAGIVTFDDPYRPASNKEKADRLLDAFGELLGRRLDRPTAGSIGKLLNNRLVDRPTLIDKAKIATLKKYEQGHTGQYQISVGKADVRGNSTTAVAESGETMSRTSLISPRSTQNRIEGGGDGDIGDIVSAAQRPTQAKNVTPHPEHAVSDASAEEETAEWTG